MTSLHCFLLIAFFVHTCPPMTNAKYLVDEWLPSLKLNKDVATLAKAVYQFATDLHAKLSKFKVDDNIVFSPTSIYVALAMLYPGSGGETKTQLAAVLHLYLFKSDEDKFYKSIQIMLETMSSTEKNYTLKMANRLFSQKKFEIKDNYLSRVEEYFHVKLESLDFKNDPSGSRSEINNRVSEMTSDKIKELFPKDAITSDTAFVLANAVYFNGSWLYKFDKELTKPQTFSVSETEKIQIPMMHLSESKVLRYTAVPMYKLLELPYSDESVSLLLALDQREGRPNFYGLLSGEIADVAWKDVVDVFTNTPVRLSLPKFSLQSPLDLKDSLQALGVKNLFEKADLSGVSDSGPLELSKAIHKVYINVEERGTEAAAATGLNVVFQVSSVISKVKDIDFIVDRPFLFLLVEKKTGCILLLGQIQNPLKTN